MRALLLLSILAFLCWDVTAAHAQCTGRMATRPMKNGGTMQVCLDDKYSTCIQNNRKGGWTQQEAQARCDKLKALGKVH
jgi:hypothetical protein